MPAQPKEAGEKCESTAQKSTAHPPHLLAREILATANVIKSRISHKLFAMFFCLLQQFAKFQKQQNTEIQYNKQRIHLLPREPSIHSKNKRRFQLTGLHIKPNFSNQYNPSKSNATRQNTGHNALTAKYKHKWDYKKEYLFSQMQCQSE